MILDYAISPWKAGNLPLLRPIATNCLCWHDLGKFHRWKLIPGYDSEEASSVMVPNVGRRRLSAIWCYKNVT